MDYHKELKKKLSASYERQVKQWMASDPAQLIAAAEDIAAIRFIHENLVDTISDEDASFLLTLDDPLWDVSSKWVEENGSDMVHDDDIHHCIWSLWEECTDGQTQKEDGIYQLISNAENEMKEYAHKVKQLSADKIYQHSAETAAKENLLCSIIHDSYDLDDADLAKILQQEEPLDTLYQFLLGGKTDLSSESSISSILNEYNAQCQEETATMDTGGDAVLKKILRSKRGEGYLDVCILVLCAMLVIALAVRVFPVFVAKQQLDTFATELIREAEIAGRVGSETDRREQALREQTGLNPDISWSRTGRIQLNQEVAVTVTYETNIGLFSGFGSFPITLRADATGKSEVYWK